MQYFISFLEGIITFISPCLLPMLPIYISYFAGGIRDGNMQKTVGNALGFILGFSLVFIMLGAFAGWLGSFLIKYQTVVNVVTGAIVLLFGLKFMEIIRIPWPGGGNGSKVVKRELNFRHSCLFGMVFSISWTPCVGVFLGSALMMASHQGSVWQGTVMLICYSLGLGIPFLISAVLIGRLKSAFDFIKRHYRTINIVSGIFLCIIGILMMTGLMGRFLALLSF